LQILILTKEHIAKVVQEYFKDKPVNKVYLFGSYARGEADENSNVDLLVDLDRNQKIGWSFYEWHEELKSKMKKNVDVISNTNRPEEVSNWNFIVKINQNKFLINEKGG
jgi:uncharacterized protein